MKLLLPIGLLCIAVTVISCKKGDDSFSWNKELNGSAWAGELKYTSGAYTGVQPFSIVMGDGSLTWYQLSGSYPAQWHVDGDKVIITFTDSSKISAMLSKDSWSNFINITANGFLIQNLSRSSVPVPDQLTGSEWKGKYSSSDLTMDFISGQKVVYAYPTGSFITPYTVYGAGIKYSRTVPLGAGTVLITGYGVFTSSTTIKGAELIMVPGAINPQYLLWDGKKQ
jgi:hypothetical protein